MYNPKALTMNTYIFFNVKDKTSHIDTLIALRKGTDRQMKEEK